MSRLSIDGLEKILKDITEPIIEATNIANDPKSDLRNKEIPFYSLDCIDQVTRLLEHLKLIDKDLQKKL